MKISDLRRLLLREAVHHPINDMRLSWYRRGELGRHEVDKALAAIETEIIANVFAVLNVSNDLEVDDQ